MKIITQYALIFSTSKLLLLLLLLFKSSKNAFSSLLQPHFPVGGMENILTFLHDQQQQNRL